MSQTSPCCDDCYDSHGDCVERGTCLCHRAYDAPEVTHVFCLNARAAAELCAAVRLGAADLTPAVRVVGPALETRYPDGRTRARRVDGVDTRGASSSLVVLRLGDVYEDKPTPKETTPCR